MGLFKSLRGTKDGRGNGSTNTPGSTGSKPKEHQRQHQDKHQHQHQSPHQNSQASPEQYQPPPGPPPPSSSSTQHRYQVTNPDGNSNSNTDTNAATTTTQFLPPPGPPPGYHSTESSHPSSSEAITTNTNANETFLPPPGPPPTTTTIPCTSPTPENQDQDQDQKQDQNPPPYHDWTIIPDTSLLPPPPPLPEDYSPTNNASYDSAARAHEWCAAHPVYTPSIPSLELRELAARGEITLEPPPVGPLRGPGFVLRRLDHPSPSSASASVPSSASSASWLIRTPSSQQDTIIMSSIPLYFATVDNPLLDGSRKAKKIYYEITIHKIANSNSGVAIGFAAKPYPPWRLPGWHRASLGVHGDDGRRFVNDSWGGRDFVDPFPLGETIGVGMELSAIPLATPRTLNSHKGQFNDNGYGDVVVSAIPKVKTTAFLTTQTQSSASARHVAQQVSVSKWEIDEERDIRDEGVDGLMGEGDLYAAIGVFGGVELEVRFGETRDKTP